MKDFQNNAYFWQKIDTLYQSGDFVVARKKGTAHPKYPYLIYPCDYGYVKDLNEDNGIACFKSKGRNVDTVVVCADILSKTLEAKLLVGLNEEEEEAVLHFLNTTDFQKCILIRRGKDVPSWALTE